MKKALAIMLAILPVAVWLSAVAQQPVPGLHVRISEKKLRGRIVLYDWIWHETTSNDDFVIKILDAKNGVPLYARVIYKPFWGWDAPTATPKEVLDRWAFVGRGSSWEFTVHAPQTDQELADCSAPGPNPKYQDENGSGELPRYISTPGAEGVKIPPIGLLPCFIMKRGGLTRVMPQ